jgi:hypothetical protein
MQKDYFKEISDIKNLMNKSTRFISLSGLSGIIAGVYAILGAAIAYFYILPPAGDLILVGSLNYLLMILDLALIALFSVGTAAYMTTKKAKQNNEKIWDATTQRLLLNFCIPLFTGGLYILIQFHHQHYGISAALMLIFYGLALVNASKYTLGTVKYLGYLQIVLGLICAAFPGYGFYFWVLGFGLLHIIYGSVMYANENKQNL